MRDHVEDAFIDGSSRPLAGRAGHGMTILGAALALGIASVRIVQNQSVWILVLFAALLLLAAAVALLYRRRRAIAMALLAGATVFLGAAWFNIRQHHTSPNDLAVMIGDEAALIRVRGVALDGPVVQPRIGGAMARFDYRSPSTYFPMRVEALIDRVGHLYPITGEVLVRVDESVPPFRAGDHVETTGFLQRPLPPRNPGEFNYREYAKSLGQAGFLGVERRELLRVTPAQRNSIYEKFLNWRAELRRRASAWLLAELPPTSRTERDSLLAMLMLGQRDEQIDGVYSAFQRVGLAHLLAISGFHLGVLAGFVLLIARFIFSDRRWQGLCVIAFVLLYLTLVEARMPVMRAGVMTIVASVALMGRRRLHVGGLCGLTALALLLWRPDQLFNAGFQLTFGVVFGLIYLAPRVRRRMFGPPDYEAASVGRMIGQWLRTAGAAALTSWLIALPIVMHHFGLISPLGVLLSVITLPLASALLALGFVKMICAAILPSLGLIIGVPLSICAELLLSIVMTIDAAPGSVIAVRNPSVAWTIATLACIAWWLHGGPFKWKSLRRVVWRFRQSLAPSGSAIQPIKPLAAVAPASQLCSALAVFAWFFWPAGSNATLRIDMFAVGDGSCYVIRSGSSAVMFDAGSSSDLNVARRSLIPAMRRLGITSLDAILISHNDIDHYSAVVDLARELHADEIIVTPQFERAARADPLGPAAFALEQLVRERLVVRNAAAGEVRQFGDATWTWIHPRPDQIFQRDNDASMVVRIEIAGRRVLMCGDIQRDAIAHLLRIDAADDLIADVIELPHHGGYSDVAPKFIERIDPAIVMQSTGWTRWSRDQWAAALVEKERLVTARDGACWVEIRPNGELDVGRFIKPEDWFRNGN